MIGFPRKFVSRCLSVLLSLGASVVVESHCFSQDIRIEAGRELDLLDDIFVDEFVPLALGQARGGEDHTDQTEDSGQQAMLKTDPDLEAILEKADRFANDGNYRVATELWQAVLDRSGDAMYSSNGVIFYSLADQVERTLARLPAEGLETYRVRADADARALLAAGARSLDGTEAPGARRTGLGQVVRNYFLSSVGDDAAFQLGCLSLDGYDFVGALRSFNKVLDRYPDSDLPADQIHLRVALCHAFLGNRERADAAIEAAKNARTAASAGGSVSVEQLVGMMDQLSLESVEAIRDHAIRMHLSGPRRYGVQPSLPANFLSNDLVAAWQFFVEPKTRYSWTGTKGRTLVGERSHGEAAADTRNGEEENLIKAWRDKGWRPSGQLLFADDHIYFKSAADITAWDRQRLENISVGGDEASQPNQFVAWRSVWRNGFQIDQATQMLTLMQRQYGNHRARRGSSKMNVPTPVTPSEVQFFGDRIYQQMSICGDQLYAIEDEAFNDQVSSTSRSRKVRVQYNTSIRRVRKNQLTAYDATTGRLQWTLPRIKSDEESDPQLPVAEVVAASAEPNWLDGGGFMAAPVGFQDLILAPVNSGGAISVYALDPNDGGRTVWKSYLCDEPETGSVMWSPIHLSLEGSDLFVNSGYGTVFVLDAVTGKIRFARRYSRTGKADTRMRNYSNVRPRLQFDGWSSDVVIPWQDQLICFGSDTDTIFALDRNTGRAIWSCPMNPIGHKVDYLLGVVDGLLYAAGPTTIIAYDLNGEGRMVWGADDVFDGKDSLGRGMLTSDAIYIPLESGIYQFSLAGKKGRAEVINKVGVRLGTDAPVGNLFSDGQRIWVHGGNRLYALQKQR